MTSDNALSDAWRPLREAERVARLDELGERLPRSPRGHLTDQGQYPIRPNEAETWSEYRDACEYWDLLQRRGADRHDDAAKHPLKYHALRPAIEFAREAFRAEGWPSPSCHTGWSTRQSDWIIFDASFSRDLEWRIVDRAWKNEKTFACYMSASSNIRRAYQQVMDGRYSEEGSPIHYASIIYCVFLRILQHHKNRSAPVSRQTLTYITSDVAHIGFLYGEAMYRFAYEREIRIGSGQIASGRRGAEMRRSESSAADRIVQTITKYVEQGHSKQNAARMAYSHDKLGASPQANRAAYYRSSRRKNL